MKCTEKMYEAFKAVAYAPESQNETVRDLTMNAIEAAMAASSEIEELRDELSDLKIDYQDALRNRN